MSKTNKPFVGEAIDKTTGRIIDLSGKTIKKFGKKKTTVTLGTVRKLGELIRKKKRKA